MTRRQRNWTFWILVFSLNLVPLVAQGGHSPPARKAPKTAKKEPAKPSTSPSPAPSPSPEPRVESASTDLTVSDLNGSLLDFDAKVVGPNPNNKAKLFGLVFNDCVDDNQIEIKHIDAVKCSLVPGGQIPGKSNGADITGAAFQIIDKGFKGCMQKHKDNKDHCSADKCKDISRIAGGTWDLSSLSGGDVHVMLLRHDPDMNEEHGNLCEEFPTALRHRDQGYIDAAIQQSQDVQRERQIEIAERSLSRCWNNGAQVEQNKNYCMMLSSMGEYSRYSSVEECMKKHNGDRHELQILADRAAHDPLDSLDSIVSDLNEWANNHASECRKAVPIFQVMAKRLATQRISRRRGEDRDPFEGYDSAYNLLQSGIDNSSCLDEDGTLAEMQQNLQINRTEKVGELYGMNSMEYMQQYQDLASNLQESYQDSCSSWEMDPLCRAATSDMQKLGTMQNLVLAANQKQMQAQTSLCQMEAKSAQSMIMLSPQCQNLMFGGNRGMFNFSSIAGYSGAGGGGYGFGRL